MEKHLRVDIVKAKQEGDNVNKSEKSYEDYKTTVFVGNLPFVVSEEEVRAHFA